MGGRKQSRRLAAMQGHPVFASTECGKAKYDDEDQAREAATERSSDRLHLSAYHCILCDAWHLTSGRRDRGRNA